MDKVQEINFEYKMNGDEYKDSYWFLFSNSRLLLCEQEGVLKVPFVEDIKALKLLPANVMHTGSVGGLDCFAANFPGEDCAAEGFCFMELRQVFGRIEDQWFWAAGRAYHLLSWQSNNRFCGRCGGSMEMAAEERALKCPACGYITYPRISPAVIVAILKGDEILLAHSARFATGFYSLVAGFVEPGETLEAAVAREIREEVGIEVKNIRYFGNQPWPFPDSLMVGFTAEYASGEIQVDNVEVTDAGWYTIHNLPEIPGRVSIARRLIDWYVESRKRNVGEV